MKFAALLLASLFLVTTMPAQDNSSKPATPEAAATTEFNGMVDWYFDAYFRFHPTEGTAAGFHQYDNQLEDLSQKSLDRELAFLTEAKQGAGYAHTELLTETQRQDLKLISNAINARLLELHEIRMWQKNPDIYSSSATASVYLLMVRNFAPPEERLKSVIAAPSRRNSGLDTTTISLPGKSSRMMRSTSSPVPTGTVDFVTTTVKPVVAAAISRAAA